MSIDCLVYKVLSIGCLSIGCLSIQRQCAGFETIDAAFKTFVNQTTLDDFQYYVVELQTTANKYFRAEKIREYLTILKASDGGLEACHLTSHYILVVLGRILSNSFCCVSSNIILFRKVPPNNDCLLHSQGGP